MKRAMGMEEQSKFLENKLWMGMYAVVPPHGKEHASLDGFVEGQNGEMDIG
jgi:hypothetical protein